MAIETEFKTELKFEVTPQDLQRLAATRILQRTDGLPSKQKYLVSTYFDTPGQKLRQNGVSLEVRQAGKKRVQAIRTTEGGIASHRGGWERRLDGDEPDLRAARGTALQPLVSRSLRRDLKPLFATHVHRTFIPLRPRSGSRVDLALGEGHVRAGEKTTPLAEAELELRKGGVADLFRAARLVAELVPARLAFKSGAEHGYELLTDQPARCVHAPKIILRSEATLTQAFQTVASSVLWHLAANEPAVAAGVSEGIHQMRVAARRLRAAISIFSEMLQGKQTERVKRDLRWLAAKLAPVRELDVFLQANSLRLDEDELPVPGLSELVAELTYRRALAAEAARDALGTARYRFLVFNALEWIENGDWRRKSRHGERPAMEFATRLIARRSRNVRQRSKHIGRLDPDRRHDLRLAMKKLRYTILFFESLYDRKRPKRLSRFRECLRSLQDDLGALNDIDVHQRLLTGLAAGKSSAAPNLMAFAAGVVAGSERSLIGPLLDESAEAARKLRKAKKIWG